MKRSVPFYVVSTIMKRSCPSISEGMQMEHSLKKMRAFLPNVI